MRNYAFYSLSMYSEVTIEYMVDTVAFTIENFIFCYLGIIIPLMWNDFNLSHFGISVAALAVSRIISVIFITWFVNCFKKKSIPFSHQVALIFCGIRGAVSFYLVLNMTFLKDVGFYF
jgi:solute carrier family 9 (sodium/hydrogen exchanger), member 1